MASFDLTGLKPVSPAPQQDFDISGLRPVTTQPAAPQRPQEEDSWGRLAVRVAQNAPTMFKQAGGGLLQFIEERPPMPGMPTDLPRVIKEGAGRRWYDEATQDLQENAPNVDPESLKGYAYDIVQGTIQMGPMLAASLATRSPGIGMSIIGGQVTGHRYGESRAEGRTPEQSTMDAAFYAAAEAIPERIPLGILMKPGGRFLTRLMKAGAAEGVQEMFTEALQSGYDAGVLDENMTWEQAVNNIRRAGIVGAGVGVGLATASHPFARGAREPDEDMPVGAEPAEAVIGAEQEPLTLTREVTADDIASPMPTQDIAEGKRIIDEALAAAEAEALSPEPDIFVPQADWAEVPPHMILEPGLDIRMDIDTGQQWARQRQEEPSVTEDTRRAVPPDIAPQDQGRQPEQAVRPPDVEVRGTAPAGPGGVVQEAQREADRAAAPLDLTGLTPVEARPKRAPRQATGTEDATTFLALRGGLRDDEGHDLRKGRGLQKAVPGAGTLIRAKGGMSIDEAGEALWEAGYFGPPDMTPRPSEQQVLELLERAGTGKVYAPEIQAQRDAEDAERRAKVQEKETRAEIDRIARELGEPLPKRDRDLIYGDMLESGASPEDAVSDYVERLAMMAEDAFIEETGEDYGEAPFEQVEDGGAPGEAGAAPTTIVEDEAARAARGAPAAEARPEEPATELTEAGEQALVTGVTPVTDLERVEAGLKAPKKAKAPQKPADEGLFDVEGRKQTDLLDVAPAEPVGPRVFVTEVNLKEERKKQDRQFVEEMNKLNLPESSQRIIGRVEIDYGFTPTVKQATDIAIDIMDGETAFDTAVQTMLDEAGKKPKPKTRALIDSKRQARVEKIEQTLNKGGSWGSITELRSQYGAKAGTAQAKTLEEDFEAALVNSAKRSARQTEAGDDPDVIGFRRLVDLYGRQPKLGTRTSGSVQRQAYSTPAPIAYLASKLANIQSIDHVYEPTAGNGMLLLDANPKRSVANEIDPERAAALKAQGLRLVEQRDASEWRPNEKFNVVIMNPPFGTVKDEAGQSRRWNPAPGYFTNEIDHAIALKSLEAMKDNGRAVLILGGVNKLAKTEEARSKGYNGKAKREFFKTLYDQYNVVEHFTVAGKLYERQGAGWPVDVIVVQGRGKSARALPAADVPKVFNSFEEIDQEFFDERNGSINRPWVGAAPSAAAPDQPAGRPGARERAETERERVSPAAGVPPGRPAAEGAGPRAGAEAGPGGVRGRGAGRAAGEAGRAARDRSRPRVGEPGISQQPAPEGRPGAGRLEAEQRQEPRRAAGPEASRAPGVARPGRAGTERRLEDFDTIFDEELAAAFEKPATAKPARKPRAPRKKAAAKKAPRGAKEAAKSATKETISGLDEAFSGLTRIFGGGPNRLGMGPSFDEETYRQARPHFVAAAKHFQTAGSDLRDMIRALIDALRENFTRDAIEAMRPYLRHFIEEVTDGTIDLAETTPPAAAPPTIPAEEVQETDSQVTYKPRSKKRGLGTLVPVNLRSSVNASLARLEEEVGSIDEYVARELGYDQAGLEEAFAAEQIDAIALGLLNLSKGKGFIIGDQTGIGKGRFVAAMLRWAIRNDKVPIFVTEKPNLYADMYRDLTDIGMKDVRPLMTNAAEKMPLDEDGDKVLKTPAAGKHNAALLKMAAGEGLDPQYNMVFTTYSQMQTLKKERTPRMAFLENLARGNVVVFDESHNAGGTESERKQVGEIDRAGFAREMAGVASSVIYSSATYAKRPSVMSLYFKTDMSLAVGNIEDLGPTIQKGGVPMQQAVAAMLTRAGQYIRRERSFSGVKYDAPVVPVDTRTYSDFSTAIKLVQDFSETFVPIAVKAMDKRLKAEAKSITPDGSTGGAGASSTNFTSIMHNLVDQMLLAIKAPQAVERAVAKLEADEKVVITVANTMGSFIEDYVDQAGLVPGDAIAIDFNTLIQRYLERSRTIMIKPPFSKEKGQKVWLSDADLGPAGVKFYESAKAQIANMRLGDLPVSPIDYIKSELMRRGYKIGEITGRTHIIGYDAKGQGTYMKRPLKEVKPSGRRKVINQYNAGQLDGLIINQAGSTGLSIHASAAFKDQRKRNMIIAQAEKNIDTHMQTLGRVHRTGQVVKPAYEQLVADVPAEKRPAAVLAKKMASLNANTTGARGGALTAKDTPDFMNEYGDQVVAQLMADNAEMHTYLGSPLKEADVGYEVEDAVRRVTGRIPLLPVEDQENLYEMIEGEYKALLAQMEAAGESTLEAKLLDLDAVPEASGVAVTGQEGGSPFSEPVYAEVVNVKRLGKPHSTQEVMDRVAEETGVTPRESGSAAARLRSMAKPFDARDEMEAFRAYRAEYLEGFENEIRRQGQGKRLDDIENRVRGLLRNFPIGSSVRLKRTEENLHGVVTRIRKTGKTKNPLALGSWKMTVYLADPRRQIEIPFSQLFMEGDPRTTARSATEIVHAERIGMTPIIEAFDDMQTEAREKRVIMTGNMLAAADHVKNKGHIVQFTQRDGATRQGILMPRDFNYEEFEKGRPVEFSQAGDVLKFLRETPRSSIVRSQDREFSVSLNDDGDVVFRAAASKAKGGRYFLSDAIIKAVGSEFVKSGSTMRAEASAQRGRRAIQGVIDSGVRLVATENLEEARRFAGASKEKLSLPRKPEEASRSIDAKALTESLNRRLGQLGLSDKVRARAVSGIRSALTGRMTPAQGRYLNRVIDVALSAQDPAWVLNHEAIHGLRELGLFRAAEWRTLEKAARADKARMQELRQRYSGMNLTEEELTEESIADSFADWSAGRQKAKGFMRDAFERIRGFLKGLGNALRGQGFATPESIFAAIEAGKVGRRRQAPRTGAAPASAAFSMPVGPETRDTAENRTRAAQGFIARGQPLDRAMRVPFDWLGGVNEQGEWRPGAKMFDRAERVIKEARFKPDSKFSWLNAPLMAARAGLIDRYGLPPEYIQRERGMDLDKRAIAQMGIEALRDLRKAGVGIEEARILQAMRTEGNVGTEDLKALSAPIFQAIDELGKEAVHLGMISADSYERNVGSYLHRVYMKHEGDEPALSKWFTKFLDNRRKRIIGEQLKGRGIFLDVDAARLTRDDPDFTVAKRGKPVKGEKFIMLDRLPSQEELPAPIAREDITKPVKVEHRVFWPADREIPAKYRNYTDRGTWELRRIVGKKYTLWRDYSPEERAQMGEIMDARYTIGKTYALMANDLATGRFYKDVSENGDWTRTSEPAGNWINGAEARWKTRAYLDESVEWVKVPNTDIPQTGGKKRWGALAGKWVRTEIWRDLNEIDMMSQPTFWTKLLTQWKKNKTGRSPVVHMNNVMSNMIFMDLADVRFQDLIGGLRSYINEDADYKDAADHGAFGADLVTQELKRDVLDPVLQDLQRDMASGREPLTARAGAFGKISDAVYSAWLKIDTRMLNLYQLEDEIFRMALYKRRRSLGDNAEHAANEARAQFLDYDIRAPWVNMARRSVLPFISYTYRAAPVIARSLAVRPWKLPKYFAVAYALNALAYMIEPGDEDEERRSLRPQEKGYTWIGVERMQRMPYRDANGNPVFLDIRRWIPAGDIFDLTQGSSAFAIPAPVQFGGPLMLGAELMLNKSAFTGEEITNDLTDTSGDKAKKVGDWAWKSWMPSAAWVPGSWYWRKIGLSLKGATDSTGRPYPLPEAVASSFGVKLKPQDVEENMRWRAYEFDLQRRALAQERRRIDRLNRRGIVSEEAFKESMEALDEKLRRLAEEEAKVLQ